MAEALHLCRLHHKNGYYGAESERYRYYMIGQNYYSSVICLCKKKKKKEMKIQIIYISEIVTIDEFLKIKNMIRNKMIVA